MSKTTISVIAERDVTEVQWGREEPAQGQIDGYVLIHQNGALTFPFRDDNDYPFVLVIERNGVTVIEGEDQVDHVTSTDRVVWSSKAEQESEVF